VSFWLKFAISEALTLASLLVNSSTLTPAQKSALENFIASGTAVLATF